MALLFSRVTISDGDSESEFFAGGFPQDSDDLDDYSAYHEFLDEITEDTEIVISVTAFLYGEGETVKATFEDIANITIKESSDSDFFSSKCDCIGEANFSFAYCPSELF